eukprot:6194513-Pyramimonas_sp.AAC.1
MEVCPTPTKACRWEASSRRLKDPRPRQGDSRNRGCCGRSFCGPAFAGPGPRSIFNTCSSATGGSST